MAWKKVKEHDIVWIFKKSVAEIELILDEKENETTVRIHPSTYTEYCAIVDMLRCGKTVWYEDELAVFRTSKEKPHPIKDLGGD